MDWINKMKERYTKKRIQSLDQVSYPREFIDLASAKSIGMIVNVSACEAEDADLIRSYAEELRNRDKKVLIIEINYDKKSVPQFEYSLFINPTKLNWYEYPIPSVKKQIEHYDLDILMNFDPSIRMTSKYICSIARAKTRTGVRIEGFESCYELMIRHEEEEEKTDMRSMITEFDYFLNMID